MRRFFWKLGRGACFKTPEELAEDAKKIAAAGGGGGGQGGTPAPGLVDGRTVKALEDDLARVTALAAKHEKLLSPDDDPDDDPDDVVEGDDVDDIGEAIAEGVGILSGGLGDEDDEDEEPAEKPKKKGRAAA